MARSCIVRVLAVVAGLLLALTLCSGHDLETCKYVTIPVCGKGAVSTDLLVDQASSSRGPVGPPGKSGAQGLPGLRGSPGGPGPKGQRGEPYDMELVEAAIEQKWAALDRSAMGKTGTDLCEQVNQRGIHRCYGDLFLCDGQGWTVIQHRHDGSINFERTWPEYSQGFGSLDGEFWTGLNTIHKLTRNRTCRLRFDLVSFDGETAFAEYSSFFVADEGKNFQISISGYTGTAGDSMNFHDGMVFSTKDRDNDQHASNCASNRGGWWYKNCYRSSPNAVWGRSAGAWTRILWFTWKGDSEGLRGTTMKIRCS